MRKLAFAVTCLVLSACESLPKNNTTRGAVELAARGEALGKFSAQGTERVHVVIENRGPGSLEFVVSDDRGRTIESGEIDRVRRNFTWRPLESFVTFKVRAGDRPAHFDYRVASEAPFTVQWNLTNAMAPRQ